MADDPSLAACTLAELREMLLRMEDDLGLGSFSRVERDMVYATRDIAQPDGQFSSQDLRRHTLLAAVPSATFHRALNRLAEAGYVRLAPGSLARNYVIVDR